MVEILGKEFDPKRLEDLGDFEVKTCDGFSEDVFQPKSVTGFNLKMRS